MAVQWADGHQSVAESIFLPSTEFRFHKFHYLTFIPTAEDVYDCKVEHRGLDQPLLQHWGMEPPPFASTVLTPSLFPGSIFPQHLLFLIPCVLLPLYPNFTGDLIVSNSLYPQTWGQLLLSALSNSCFSFVPQRPRSLLRCLRQWRLWSVPWAWWWAWQASSLAPSSWRPGGPTTSLGAGAPVSYPRAGGTRDTVQKRRQHGMGSGREGETLQQGFFENFAFQNHWPGLK